MNANLPEYHVGHKLPCGVERLQGIFPSGFAEIVITAVIQPHACGACRIAELTLEDPVMLLDMAKELEKTLHLHSNDLPYVTTAPGMETRMLHARVEDDFFVTQLRAAPGIVSGLHKHAFKRNGASGYTLKGRWGHDHQYLYVPGTYIFETPDVIHQFFNGPEETEVLFFGDFAVDFIDPETLGITGSLNSEVFMKKYLELCAEQGATPNFLTR